MPFGSFVAVRNQINMGISGTPLIFVFIGSFLIPIVTSQSNFYTDCGGVLNRPYSAISYRAGEKVIPNERCVWTLRSNETIRHNLVVFSFGLNISNPDHGLTATCIYSTGSSNVILEHVKINRTGTINLPGTCPLLVLTYYSGSNIVNSQGFSLFYAAHLGKAEHYSSESRHHILTNSSSLIGHPGGDALSNYTNNEISTFIYVPVNNKYNRQVRTLVTYIREELEDCREGCDRLYLYKFQPSDGSWIYESSIHSSSQSRLMYSADIRMIIFRTDGSGVRRGFHLVHSNLCCFK